MAPSEPFDSVCNMTAHSFDSAEEQVALKERDEPTGYLTMLLRARIVRQLHIMLYLSSKFSKMK